MYDYCAQQEIFYRNILVWDYGTQRIKMSAIVHYGIPIIMIRSNNAQPLILDGKFKLTVVTLTCSFRGIIIKKNHKL